LKLLLSGNAGRSVVVAVENPGDGWPTKIGWNAVGTAVNLPMMIREIVKTQRLPIGDVEEYLGTCVTPLRS
jgi:hypothetical protein